MRWQILYDGAHRRAYYRKEPAFEVSRKMRGTAKGWSRLGLVSRLSSSSSMSMFLRLSIGKRNEMSKHSAGSTPYVDSTPPFTSSVHIL